MKAGAIARKIRDYSDVRLSLASISPPAAWHAGAWIGVATLTTVAMLASTMACAAPYLDDAPDRDTGPVRELRGDEVDLLYSAEQLLIKDCMASKGFSYWPNPRDPVPEHRDFPYVVDDVDWARRNGYGGYLQHRLDETLNTNPNRQYSERLTGQQRAAYLYALNGNPDTDTTLTATLPSGMTVHRSNRSCTSAAQRDLYGDLPAWYRAVKITENVPTTAYGIAQSDSRLTAATARWSACMRTASHPFANPQQARASVATDDADGPSPQEIQLAVTEATCANRTDLAAVASQLQAEYTRKVEQAHPTEVADKRRLALAALPRARDVMRRQ